MRGDLVAGGLTRLLHGLADADASGSLQVQGPTGPARIFLRGGAVTWATSPALRAQLGARLVGAGFVDDEQLEWALERQSATTPRPKLGTLLVDEALVGRDVIRVFVQEQVFDALFEVANWDDGRYEFVSGDEVSEDLPVALPGHHVGVEIERRLREWSEIVEVLPSLDHVPDFSGSTTAQASLEPDEFTLMTNVDGRRSVRELALDLGYSEFEAARLVYGLAVLGIIELRPPAATAVAAEAPTDDIDVAGALEAALAGEPLADEPDVEVVAAGAEEEPVEEEPADRLDVARALDDVIASASNRPPPQPSELTPDDDIEPPVWTYVIEDGTASATPERPAAEPIPEHAAAEPAAEEPAAEEEPAAIAEAPAEEPTHVAEPAATEEPAAAADPPAVAEPAYEEPAAEEPDDEAPPRREPAIDRGEVAEFLRELSRLSGDEDDERPAAPPPPRPPPDPPPPPKEPEAPQRGGFRKLFGSR